MICKQQHSPKHDSCSHPLTPLTSQPNKLAGLLQILSLSLSLSLCVCAAAAAAAAAAVEMATFLLLVLAVAMSSGSDAAWCVCRSDMSNTALQKALDYACGAGADCTPIIQNGACYNPNTVLAHCSYAANSYYQRKGQAQGACDFAGTASLTSTDPGGNGCTYPATSSVAGTSGTPTTTTPTSSTPAIGTPTSTSTTPPTTTTTPTTFSPPTTGATPTGTGGVLGGLGPTGTTSSIDGSDGGLLPGAEVASLLSTLFLSSVFLLRL